MVNKTHWVFRIEHLLKLKNDSIGPNEAGDIIGGRRTDIQKVVFIASKEVNNTNFSRLRKRAYKLTKTELLAFLRRKGESLPDPDEDYTMQLDVKVSGLKVIKIAPRQDVGQA